MEFPQFRKLANGKSLYQILARDHFIELQLVGTRWFKYEFKVSQFPDLLRIEEMLQNQALFLSITANEFQLVVEQL
jgi:hypothetical protein